MVDLKKIYNDALASVDLEKITADAASLDIKDSDKAAVISSKYAQQLCMKMIGEYHIQLTVELAKQGIEI